jgi:hypothetical protein
MHKSMNLQQGDCALGTTSKVQEWIFQDAYILLEDCEATYINVFKPNRGIRQSFRLRSDSGRSILQDSFR